jgi:dTMP kinase
MKGKFIVFEGVEGAGKTTQIRRSHSWLQRELGDTIPILLTREPGGTILGHKIREILLDSKIESICDHSELLLYAADRSQHVQEVIQPHLQQGGIVLCDRFTDSTIAYQGYGRGLSLSLIQQLNQIATGGLETDLTIWLDLDVEIGLQRAKQRGKSDRLEQADLEFHLRVQQGFRELAQISPKRMIRVNANRSEEAIHEDIKQILQLVSCST